MDSETIKQAIECLLELYDYIPEKYNKLNYQDLSQLKQALKEQGHGQ